MCTKSFHITRTTRITGQTEKKNITPKLCFCVDLCVCEPKKKPKQKKMPTNKPTKRHRLACTWSKISDMKTLGSAYGRGSLQESTLIASHHSAMTLQTAFHTRWDAMITEKKENTLKRCTQWCWLSFTSNCFHVALSCQSLAAHLSSPSFKDSRA